MQLPRFTQRAGGGESVFAGTQSDELKGAHLAGAAAELADETDCCPTPRTCEIGHVAWKKHAWGMFGHQKLIIR